MRPWSQTMISEGARPWGRGRSEFANLWGKSRSARECGASFPGALFLSGKSEIGIGGGVKTYRTVEGELAPKVAPRKLGLFDPQLEDCL